MVGGGLMILIKLMADRYDFPVASRKYSFLPESCHGRSRRFFLSMTPVIILGSILLGIFTPTEAS